VNKATYDGGRPNREDLQHRRRRRYDLDRRGNVTGDAVLTQSETQYDADSNVTMVITKDRFHDETATGELGNATTAPKARVSYTTAYYDAVNRADGQR